MHGGQNGPHDTHLGFSPFTEEELRKLREETNSEMLRQELDRERQRRMELEQKVQEVLKARAEDPPAQQPPKGQAQVNNGAGGLREPRALAAPPLGISEPRGLCVHHPPSPGLRPFELAAHAHLRALHPPLTVVGRRPLQATPRPALGRDGLVPRDSGWFSESDVGDFTGAPSGPQPLTHAHWLFPRVRVSLGVSPPGHFPDQAVCPAVAGGQRSASGGLRARLDGTYRRSQGLCPRVQKWFYEKFGEYVEDFRFQPEESTVETEEPLSARRWGPGGGRGGGMEQDRPPRGGKQSRGGFAGAGRTAVPPSQWSYWCFATDATRGRLTENMRRLKRGAKPVTSFVKNLSALSDWYSVYTSAIAFTVYMNAVWHGWAIPMFLFLAILRLSLNYLIARRCCLLFARGWRIQWSIVPEVSEVVEPPKEDLTVSEKFQLVLDVAQKAQHCPVAPGVCRDRSCFFTQNLFGKMADILEKIKNLFMWVQPEITQKLYVALWAAFLASCFFPYRLVGLALGLYAGIKLFVIDFIFKRCPRLRAKYDTPYIIWKSLPTDPQLKERSSTAVSRRPQTASSRSYVTSAPAGLNKDEDASRVHGAKKSNFHEIFNLTENERPLAVCESGWRCCLINRDRKMPTDYIRNGVLYVTENYLCFESSKSGFSKRNKVIKLVDITDIQKYKVLSVLPGSGMGIAVSTPSTQKPLVFGAMVHRDEAFETIFSQYMKITAAAASGGDS
ncbi:hypothetical protein J1605_020538 [Eschrichtius robustus]|uniref:GRAM domain-containing protein 4 n=1 Tax=Eschrichtius robustus TaxID=9764 RepID=A0AB34HG75_ESCRO|nr:hypothetical protein J1605_020538 [Eschrichtius robustus]